MVIKTTISLPLGFIKKTYLTILAHNGAIYLKVEMLEDNNDVGNDRSDRSAFTDTNVMVRCLTIQPDAATGVSISTHMLRR